MSASIPDRNRRRLVSSAALLTSDQPGEAAAAVRAMDRLLARHGLTLPDLIERGLRLLPPARKPSAPPTADVAEAIANCARAQANALAAQRKYLETHSRWHEAEQEVKRQKRRACRLKRKADRADAAKANTA